jgi:hypothetical protein
MDALNNALAFAQAKRRTPLFSIVKLPDGTTCARVAMR